MRSAIDDIAAERRRQIEAEGYTHDHDDAHFRGEITMAAAAYAIRSGEILDAGAQARGAGGFSSPPPECWPWDVSFWKVGSVRQMLVKAAALIVAEIERLDREEEAGR